MKKKIMLLGGSAQQVIAIKTAKRLGYYTVLCDYLVDNPGQYEVDKFYLVSTTDKEAVLETAIKEQIDGIIAYASDPAAPTAAYVAEKLGLLTNPYNSVKILCNKDLFRNFLRENNFFTPKSLGYESREKAIKEVKDFTPPIIIKPVDSSGSKGVTVLRDLSNVEKAIDFAFSFSRCKRIIIEDYIEMKHDYLIGGDVFVYDGEIVQWGLMNCHRDKNVNSLVPVGKSYPIKLDNADFQKIKHALQELVDKLNIQFGAMNVEVIVDKDNHVWLLDIGPRSGGNMIPDLLSLIFDTDVVEMCIKAAMGDKLNIKRKKGKLYYATHNLHTVKNGYFKNVWISDKIKPYIIRKCIYKKRGDIVDYFDDASKAIGIIFMKFYTKDEMFNILDNINEYIHVNVEEL